MTLVENQIGLMSHPCLDCHYRSHCKTQHKACQALVEFVETGIPNHNLTQAPSYIDYDTLYAEGHIEQGFLYVTTDQLINLKLDDQTKDVIKKKKDNFIRQNVSDIYTASTGAKMDDAFMEVLHEWKFLWAITKYPYVVVGCIGYERRDNGTTVDFLYVREAYQRQRIGTILMRRVEQDQTKVVLAPEYDSRAFYRSLGYKDVGNTGEFILYKTLQPQVREGGHEGCDIESGRHEALPVPEEEHTG